MKRPINNPIRRFDAVKRLEWFLIASVGTVLVIRTQLWLTNYPQLGGRGLHIAHLLWGGLFMLIAIWLALIYLNRRAYSTMAIVGGVGFGFFIDEIGKFITSDNNYFFRPAAALIYLIFVALFLSIREISRRQIRNPRTALANAMSFMPYTVTGEFGRAEYRQVSRMLDRADPDDHRVELLRRYFAQTALAPGQRPSRLVELGNRLHAGVTALTHRPRFPGVIIAIVVTWGILSLFGFLNLLLLIDGSSGISAEVTIADSSFVTGASSVSTFTSGVLVVIGIVRMRQGRRQQAYRYFRRALLVSIFVTRVFSFVSSQFAAVFGLAIDIALYAAIGEIAARDEMESDASGGAPAGPEPAGEGRPATPGFQAAVAGAGAEGVAGGADRIDPAGVRSADVGDRVAGSRHNGSDGKEEAQAGPTTGPGQSGDQ